MTRIKAPVYGFYAGNDARIDATLPDTTAQMKAAGKTFEPVVYDGRRAWLHACRRSARRKRCQQEGPPGRMGPLERSAGKIVSPEINALVF